MSRACHVNISRSSCYQGSIRARYCKKASIAATLLQYQGSLADWHLAERIDALIVAIAWDLPPPGVTRSLALCVLLLLRQACQ